MPKTLRSAVSLHPGQHRSFPKDRAAVLHLEPSCTWDHPPTPSESAWSSNTTQTHKAIGLCPPSLRLKQRATVHHPHTHSVLAEAGAQRPASCTCSSGIPLVAHFSGESRVAHGKGQRQCTRGSRLAALLVWKQSPALHPQVYTNTILKERPTVTASASEVSDGHFLCIWSRLYMVGFHFLLPYIPILTTVELAAPVPCSRAFSSNMSSTVH